MTPKVNTRINCFGQGMRTYDYVLAMKEENNQFMQLDSPEDSDYSSDESIDSASSEKPKCMSRFICSSRGGENRVRILHYFLVI